MSQVKIVCTDPSHDGRELTLYTLERHSGEWDEGMTKIKGAHRFHRREAAVTLGTDDKVQMADEHDTDPVGRTRWVLRCTGACGEKGFPARGEKLTPILDKLSDGGMRSISLSRLRKLYEQIAC